MRVACQRAPRAPPAQAWGNDGHRIVGDIAWRFLKPKAKEAVQEYLTDQNCATLADAATWPDTYARRFKKYDYLKPVHYVDLNPTAGSYVQSRDCVRGCVVTAIEKYSAILGSDDENVTWKAHQQALYLVAHFVGDIHQPLHVAHPDMHGGNSTMVLFFGELAKAHWVWDTGLIGKLEQPVTPPTERDDDSVDEVLWEDLAYSLSSEIAPEQAKAWQGAASAKEWANESLTISKQTAFLKTNDAVDQSYVASHGAIVRQQLQKAGVRLAALLNRVLGSCCGAPTMT